MPHKCCVATCKGNYKNGPKVAVFSFPTEEQLRKQWIWNCKRKDGFKPTKHSKVCELHFKQEDVLRQTEFFDEKTGKKIIIPLSYPRLKNGAIPSLFPDGPSHLSSSVSSRESPEHKRLKREQDALEKALACSLAEKEEYERKQMFYNLDELKICFNTVNLPDNWIVIHRPIHTMILNISNDNHPRILKSLLIDCNLNISVAIRNIPIKSLKQYVIPSKINNLKDLLSILEKLDLFASNDSSEDSIQNYLQIVNELMTILKEKIPHKNNEINFLVEQLSNLNSEKQQYRYSADFLIFSTLLHTISPHAYNFIRNSENIIMPHPRTIQKIFSDFNIYPINEQYNQKFLSYIKFKFQELSEKDLLVILMIDEIHLNQAFDYKGGNLCGMAYNCKNAASSAYVFMIRSLLSVYKDVVHILPVKNT
ncbi:uncharacterized protein LOC118190548 [Stegodyphus dumicola]|uniref:uncharacterized protein LOC118190548 n=1 Tax=Stegodyphus dumicola TaxID=202533 RepID=UPI0015B03ED4|nr:uncharacterized protein LOC118190548 [Stegodyphus dumicola]